MPFNDLQLTDLVDMDDLDEIWNEVRTIVLSINPQFDFTHVDKAYSTVIALFTGRYPGFRQCNTMYHDLFHTSEIMLAMTRLIHGAIIEGVDFTDKHINLGVISALMHDTGYIQTADDTVGTGAKYTMNHIQRSVDFTGLVYGQDPYFSGDGRNFSDILFCTGLNTRIGEIRFSSRQMLLLGQMLGTADLLGQMADRHYLEKLLHLYSEFVEGKVPGFESEYDLLKKTTGFYELTRNRFANELGDVRRYAVSHFRVRWDKDEDLYNEQIERNIAYLRWVLDTYPAEYRKFFRRKEGSSVARRGRNSAAK
jgi:hypothetical protein